MTKKIRFAAAAAAAAMAIALLPQVGKQSVRADESESGDASTENVEIAINALNFPDPNFRSYITGAYDIYAPSGVLTQDEIDKALYFHIEEMNITSCKGIEFFTAAETFDCHGNEGLLELDLSNNPNLREVICRGCTNLSSLNVSGTTKLERLLCYNTALVTLDVSKNANLTHLDCAPNHSLKTLNVSGATRLGTLYCYGTEITELNLTNNPSLAYLDCYNCHSMKKLDLSGACNLTYVNCSESALEEIVFGKQMLLKELYAYENPLSNLDLSECPYLQNLDCRYTDLESLDVTACKGLLDLQCCYSNLSRLRVSNNPELRRIRCQGNPLTDLEIYACPFILETQEKGTLQLFDEDGVVVRQYSAIVPIDESASAVCEFTYNDSTKIHKIPTEHAVSVTTDGNGTASASVASGFEWTEVTLTANPNPGYQLKDWQVISGNVTVINHKFQIADANVHIKAIFEPISRAITVTTDGNGTASASASTGIIGDTITLTATPNAGYQFKEWQVISGGITITDNTFVIGTEDVEVKAVFEAVPAAKDPTFEDFVERLYTVALGRPSEAEGKAFWVDQVVNKGATGADCARFFLLDAPEFLGRNLPDDQFVEILYLTFFDRPSEADGKAYWLGRLASGTSKADVVNDFIESTEWCNVCATYGVKSGAKWHKATVASKNAIKFATRLYTCCLGREPEADGLNYWSLALTNLEATGFQAASLFFESPEFQGFNTSNEEYVKRLYSTFMGREPETDGFTYWVGLLNGGSARTDVMRAFATCPEFQEICNKYGIERGEIK